MKQDSPIQLFNIVENILILLESSISQNDNKLKCRVNLGVSGFLPPPGGPIAPSKLISTSSLNAPGKRQVKLLKTAEKLSTKLLKILNKNREIK